MMFNKSVIYETSGDFGSYKVIDKVYDGRSARVLYGGHNSPQSGVATDGGPDLLFNYNQRFLEIVESIRPSSILIIGGGAFTLPTAILNRFDDVTVDVVEIDPLLPDIAKEYFDLPDDPRLSIFTQDGREYVSSSTKKYDLIILDAFSGYSIPDHLITVEAAREYEKLLTPHGVMGINFISAYHSYKQSLTYQLHAVFSDAFATVEIFPCDPYMSTPYEQNLILLASKNIDMPRLDYFQATAIELAAMRIDSLLHDKPVK